MAASTIVLLLSLAPWTSGSPEPVEVEWHHHRRAGLASAQPMLEKDTFELEGILEWGEDESLFVVLPLRAERRRKLAKRRQVRLEELPAGVRRRLHVAPDGPSAVQIERRIGRWVRVVLARDRSGRAFIVHFFEPRRRPAGYR